jgi:hypothetical protein
MKLCIIVLLITGLIQKGKFAVISPTIIPVTPVVSPTPTVVPNLVLVSSGSSPPVVDQNLILVSPEPTPSFDPNLILVNPVDIP